MSNEFMNLLKNFSIAMCMALMLQLGIVHVSAMDWEEGRVYLTGEVVTYNDESYKCLVNHTAWAGANWNPQRTPSLWEVVSKEDLVEEVSKDNVVEEETPQDNVLNEETQTEDIQAEEIQAEDVQEDSTDIVEWQEGESYVVGQVVLYDGVQYRCIVDHTAWVGTNWNPASTPTLWVAKMDGMIVPEYPSNDEHVDEEEPGDAISNEEPTLVESKGEWGEKIYAPYVDVMLWPTPSINEFRKATDNKYYTLAFILSNGGKPAWGGITPYNNGFYKDEISKIRQNGGDVIVSFGGANGIELALEVTDVAKLQQAYQSVIDEYQLTWVDFDIEGFAVEDRASVMRRNQAIAGLQKDNPNLTIAYCLPVMPEGLTDSGLFVLKDAKEKGVNIDVVNIMTMDYGPGYTEDMGKYAIEACKNTEKQIRKIGLGAKLGNTPMIGRNDVSVETFTLEDARELLDWANANDNVRLLSMWSITRDKSQGTGLYNCTMIPQDDFDFTNIFKEFNAQ